MCLVDSMLIRFPYLVGFYFLLLNLLVFAYTANASSPDESIFTDNSETTNKYPVNYLDRSGIRELVFLASG